MASFSFALYITPFFVSVFIDDDDDDDGICC
jgi:hypothetical protein